LRSRRRSRSEVPPQIPNCSLLLSAYSRHSARTGQPEHTARAAFDEPPRSGKKISGSTSEHRAAPCQSTGCRSLVVIRCIPGSLSVPRFGASPRRLSVNNNVVILRMGLGTCNPSDLGLCVCQRFKSPAHRDAGLTGWSERPPLRPTKGPLQPARRQKSA
jgi:hypothetical protein